MESTIGVDFYLSEIDVDGKKIKVPTHTIATRLTANTDDCFCVGLYACRLRFGTQRGQRSTCPYQQCTTGRRMG